MKSCLYAGWVRHRRFAPCPHAFRYRLFLLYLDLAELPQAFDGRWLWSARRPALALAPRGPLRRPGPRASPAVRDLVEQPNGPPPDGRRSGC